MNKFVEVKNSMKHEKGLFALKDFKKGEIIYILDKGKVITSEEIKNLSEIDKGHMEKIGENQYEIIEFPGYYINHSCESNAGEKIEGAHRIGVALKDIRKGDEITIDYDKIEFFEPPFKCYCGSKKCRGFVQGRK